MNKRIEGTFADYEDLKERINGMLAQGFAAKQLLVLTRNPEGRRLSEETTIEVMITSEHEESLWDKIVSFFTVDLDDDEDEDDVDEEEIFEDYGIDEEMYERFEEALEDGEYLLLIDDAPPAQQEHSQFMIRDGIIPEEETAMNNDFTDKTAKSAKPDWTNADDEVNGDVEKHTTDATKKTDAPTEANENPDLEEDTTGEPIEAADPHGDPTMADENIKLEPMQFDEEASHPESEDDSFRMSRDPFGGETEQVEAGESGEDVEPEYDDTDTEPPAL